MSSRKKNKKSCNSIKKYILKHLIFVISSFFIDFIDGNRLITSHKSL